MRTYEELEQCNFTNITYGELLEYGLACELCPFSYRGGGCDFACGPKGFFEPPCVDFDEDDVLIDKFAQYEENALRYKCRIKRTDQNNTKKIKRTKKEIKNEKI